MCLNAKAAAAAESSVELIPLIKISKTEGKAESPPGEASSHFEYAPIVKQTERVPSTNINLKSSSISNLREQYVSFIEQQLKQSI